MEVNKQIDKSGKGFVRNERFFTNEMVESIPENKFSLDKEIQKKFLTPTKFAQHIEEMVKESKGLINYIDAIVVYCEQNDVEIESVPKLLSKPLKEKLKRDAQHLNYVKRTSKGVLPV